MGALSSGRPLRGRTVFILAAAAHFALTRVVSALTLNLVGGGALHTAGNTLPLALGLLSKGLYFPLISLALYPRGLFPGDWILVPIAANSLVWGLAAWGAWRLLPKRGGSRRGRGEAC